MTQSMKNSYNVFKQYFININGAIAIAFAIMAPVVVGAAGMAVDYSQAYLVQQRLGQAIDAAALAAAAQATSQAEVEQKVNEFFDLNYPEEKLGITFEPEVVVNGDQITVSGYAYYTTFFLRLIGIEEINVDVQTTVQREVGGIEAALVLDVTGSMSGSKIQALRDATESFINVIFSRVTNPDYLKVALVPYAVTVNLGSEAPDFVNSPYVPGRPGVGYSATEAMQWRGCVMARDYPYDTNDASTAEGGYWDAYWWEHTADDTINNYWDPFQGGSLNLPYGQCNNRRTPNLGCPVDNPIVPLTNDQDALLEAADNIVYWCRGGTLGNIGMSWGWRVLSPEPPFTQGKEYENPFWRKAIIMMTDGENQLWKKPDIQTSSDYSPYGYIEDGVLGTTSRNVGLDVVNSRFLETCEMVKSLGITVYTVTFGSSIIGKPSEQKYIDCATDETKYYPAATNEELVEAFTEISRELSNLRISQ